jgi:hypothetical protein
LTTLTPVPPARSIVTMPYLVHREY